MILNEDGRTELLSQIQQSLSADRTNACSVLGPGLGRAGSSPAPPRPNPGKAIIGGPHT